MDNKGQVYLNVSNEELPQEDVDRLKEALREAEDEYFRRARSDSFYERTKDERQAASEAYAEAVLKEVEATDGSQESSEE